RRPILRGDDDPSRAERVHRLPDHRLRPRALLEVEVSYRPAGDQVHDLGHQRYPEAGQLTQPAVAHAGPRPRAAWPVVRDQLPVRGSADIEFDVFGAPAQGARIRLVAPGPGNLAPAPVSRDRGPSALVLPTVHTQQNGCAGAGMPARSPPPGGAN